MVKVRQTRADDGGAQWHRLRVQLSGAILFAVLLPWIFARWYFPDFDLSTQLVQTVAGSAVALLVGTWLFRSLATYPGVEASSYIVPSFAMAYGAAVLVFFVWRLEYSRLIVLFGFLASIVWYYAVHFMVQRQRAQRFGVVQFGATEKLSPIDRIEWVPLRSVSDVHGPFDAVVADLRVDLPDDWDARLADFALSGTPVYHIKHVQESLTGRVELEHLSENTLGSLLPTSAYQSAKHVLDWLAAAVLMPLIVPVLGIVALTIRLDSPGPAIFRQKRVGYRGVPFTVYKFRTMFTRHGEDYSRESAMTRTGDDRITKVGRFLRKTRIDELPQLINVLLGEMSWIGPRPEAAVLSEWYESEIAFYRYRHIVRPGITGWAQVNQGHVAAVDEVRAKLQYDFYYIKNFSPWIDLLIVARTIRTMLTGSGSR